MSVDGIAREREFRRGWYRAHVERFTAYGVAVQTADEARAALRAAASDAVALVERLARTGDLEAFSISLQAWSAHPGAAAFNESGGPMLIGQLVRRADDRQQLVRLLVDGLRVPADDGAAAERITALARLTDRIRKGAHPAPGRVPLVLSYFWALQDGSRWPVQSAGTLAFVDAVTGAQLPSEPADRYLAFRSLVRELDPDTEQFERVAAWWQATRPVFMDTVLIDRCVYGIEAAEAAEDKEWDWRWSNARALVAVGGYICDALAEDVSRALGRAVNVSKPAMHWVRDYPRPDFWSDWWIVAGGIAFRLWANARGLAIGVRPGGRVRSGFYDEAAPMVEANPVPGYEMIRSGRSKFGVDRGFAGGLTGEFVYGRWFDRSEIAGLDVRKAVVEVAMELRPLVDKLVALAVGQTPSEDDPLRGPVEEFRRTRYPSPADEQHHADRELFASLLAAENLPLVDIVELRRIWNTGRYGTPGPQSVLNTSFRDADAAEYDRMVRSIGFLLWGDGPDETRIDAVLENPDHQVRGLGESVIMKLLALAHPQRYVPVFPLRGPKGKLRMLRLLELDEPAGGTRGELQTRANDLLRGRLERLFPDDPWGMTEFLYWFDERSREPENETEIDPLEQLAEELLVDRSFLEDIVGLLHDKGQVILYGPPGTGKTYLARKLAEVLVPDASRRSLVQFHPSTSYEDFFEGYRPESAPDGTMTYRLTPGPLALLASRAAESPGKRHVMIIDEINRANLPKVFGELLFLLEYRNEQVRTLYRPEDAFELPTDLWFIGTMNTADRSIALIDAAMRRRFNFVPFFPNDGPMQGLLERWLAREGEPAWIGELLAMVNDELVEALGGPHLQLGPSHFMRKGMDEVGLRRIWRYNIEPFIEDQFFGDRSQIEFFGFDRVLSRYRDLVGGERPRLSEWAVGSAASPNLDR